MTKTYPFNPHVIPGEPLSHHEHLRITLALLMVVILGIVIGGTYVYNYSGCGACSAGPYDEQALKQSKISSLISMSPANQITRDQATHITSQISLPPQTPMSESVRSRISEEIR